MKSKVVMQGKISQLHAVLEASRVHNTCLEENSRFHVEMTVWRAKSIMR